MSADLGVRPASAAPAAPEADPTAAGRARPAGLGSGGYVAALDGVRALAALAVLVYHLGLGGLPGGLLGVDVFFVLSGFLITALLLGEHERTGRIGLGGFWMRRARRLLPALLMVLLLVAAYAAVVASPTQRASIRADGLSTLAYVANWRFAFSHQSYFHGFDAPSPLLHTWSLGVEEQFYLLWPLLVVAVLALAGRRGRDPHGDRGARALARLAGAGAAASAVVAAVLASGGTDPSRVYYGTDTRSQALLVGACVAASLAARRRAYRPAYARTSRARRVPWTALGLAGAAVVAAFWLLVPGQSALLDRGGFLLVALGAVGLVAAVTERPDGLLARGLGVAPLRALGRMSYGIYLWHWPLFLLVDRSRTGLSGGWLAVARLGVTLVVATASYRLVERPVRMGALRRALPVRAPRAAALLLPACSLVVVVSVLLVGTTGGSSSATQSLDQLAQQVQTTTGAPPAAAAAPRAPAGSTRLLVVGDSVALTLGVGLTGVQKQYGVQVDNRGWVGCGVARNSLATDGATTWPAWPDCAVWPSHWSQWVHQDRPAVASLMAGRWEVVDRFVDGRWHHLGEPAFDSYLAGELDTAVSTLSAEGAKVVLYTAPYYRRTELPDGSYSFADDPARVDRWNDLVREAAARHPHVAWVVDVNRILCPDGRYTQKIGGVDVRFPGDGIHITKAGDAMVAKVALPLVTRLASLSGAPPNAS